MADLPDEYSRDEMEKILGRAIERSSKETAPGIDHATVVEAAREIGVTEEAVDAAANEIRGEREKRRRWMWRGLVGGGVVLVAMGGGLAWRAWARGVDGGGDGGGAAAALASCPPEMASIPGGTYTLGERKDTVRVRPFCLDRTEVTVDAYRACVSNGRCTAPEAHSSTAGQWRVFCNWGRADRGAHPINCVDWGQSVSYCGSLGKRLPTEDEWEWAARNGPDATTYPWGNTPPDAQHLNACGSECPPNREAKGFPNWSSLYDADDGFAETAPVGSFPEGDNRLGVHDLAGNVWEWTASYFDPGGTNRIGRGASWDERLAPNVSASHRIYARAPSFRSNGLGFRCAR